MLRISDFPPHFGLGNGGVDRKKYNYAGRDAALGQRMFSKGTIIQHPTRHNEWNFHRYGRVQIPSPAALLAVKELGKRGLTKGKVENLVPRQPPP